MTQKPRTPVHFPRMKVRGHRNKAKLAARHRSIMIFPHAAMTIDESGHSARLDIITEWQPGCQRIEITTIKDGYGRSIPGAQPQVEVRPAPEPTPEPTFSVRFEVKNRMSDQVWDLLFGRERHGEG